MIALLRDEMLRRGLQNENYLLQPFTTTNEAKVRLVNQMQVALEQKTVTLLDDAGLISQLSAYEATYNPTTNHVSYNAPAGMHDDNCISTMLALEALETSTKTARYTFGFSH